MERVVSTISVKKARESVRVVGYSKSDRGQRFVNGQVTIDTHNLSEAEVDIKVAAAIEGLLKKQSEIT